MSYGISVSNMNHRLIIGDNISPVVLASEIGFGNRTYRFSNSLASAGYYRWAQIPNHMTCVQVKSEYIGFIFQPQQEVIFRPGIQCYPTEYGFRGPGNYQFPLQTECRYVANARGKIGSNAYGLRVFDDAGNVTYDSAFPVVNPIVYKPAIMGETVTITDGSWICFPIMWNATRDYFPEDFRSVYLIRRSINTWEWKYSLNWDTTGFNNGTAYGFFFTFDIT